MFKTRKKEIQKRLGPDGCEEPPDQSGSSKENPRNYNDQSNQQVCLKNFKIRLMVIINSTTAFLIYGVIGGSNTSA